MEAARKHFLSRKFLRYVAVGLAAFMIDALTFTISRRFFGLSIAYANGLGIMTGMVVSFTLNNIFVFGHTFSTQSLVRLGQFVLLNIFNFLFTTYYILYLSNFVSDLGIVPLDIHTIEVLVKISAIALTVCWNFLLYKLVIFKHGVGSERNEKTDD